MIMRWHWLVVSLEIPFILLTKRFAHAATISDVAHIQQRSSHSTGAINAAKSLFWSGAWMQGANNQAFSSVYGQFQVPQPQMPSGADSRTTYSAAPWVGLLDDTAFSSTDSGVIVQAGVFVKGTSGVYSVNAWWEWYPQAEHDVSLPISFGDTVSISITMTSSTSANIVITNQSKNQQVQISAQGPAGSLDKAGFIVEDELQAPFLNFGKVEFSGCRGVVGGNQVGFNSISGVVTLVDNNGKAKASGSISGTSVLDVTYTA